MRALVSRLWASIRNRFESAKRFDRSRSYLPSNVVDARIDLDRASRFEIVRKSRYFEKNSGLANRLADIWEQYTVGATGLVWNPTSSDQAYNLSVKRWLAGWYPLADVSSRQGWSVLQSLISRTWFFDGECFLLKTRGTGTPAYPRIQVLETHRVDTPSTMVDREGIDIFEGVEVDKATGRPLAYWVRDSFASDSFRRIDADYIIHVFEPSRPGQMRGLPLLYPVLNDLHDLSDLQILEMKAAKDAAKVTNVITTESGENKAGPRTVRDRFSTTTKTGTGTDVIEDRVSYVEKATGGKTVALKIGEDIKQLMINRPTAATNGYWDRLEQQICAGTGIPRSLVYASSMQGTVARADYDVAATFFRSRSQVLIDAFREVYRYVISQASAFDRSLANKPGDWLSVSIRPPCAVNVDKGRISAAQINGLKAGTETLDSILGPQGIDWRDHVDQIKAERDYCAQQLGSQSSAIDAIQQLEQIAA